MSLFRRRGVQSPDLQRILALPVRDWTATAQEMADLLTLALRRPGGSMILRPVQAAALTESHDQRGSLLMIRVSGGKTLITFLLPEVMEAKRPLLLVPAKLKHKTEVEWWNLQKHWVLPKMRIESYSMLGVAKNASYLDDYQPDLVVADEGHKLKNPRAAVTRRVKRYLSGRPDVPLVLMSGTVTQKSLRDYWHLLKLTHGDDTMPMPNQWPEMMEWSECLDVNASAQKLGPGELVALCTDSERSAIRYGGEASIAAVRTAFQRRLTSTPGVISTVDDRGVNCSLQITSFELPLRGLDDVFLQMRQTWETPDGHPFSLATDMWRHARELACGFYYVWDPRPPMEWLIARKAWAKFVRTVVNAGTADSDGQVATLCIRGDLPRDLYDAWVAVRKTFKPNTVARWVSDAALSHGARWLGDGDGICWVEHSALGKRFADAGFPYYGAEGYNQHGEHIMACKGGPIVASVSACGEGYNLQDRWSRNLILSAIPNGEKYEQLLARTHRDGQEADEVTFEVSVSCLEQWTGMQQVLRDAKYIEQSTGQPQKILYADLDLMSADEVASLGGGRWSKVAE